MDTSEQEFAKPGDTIEVTKEKLWGFGRQFVVIPQPTHFSRIETTKGDAWVSGWESSMAHSGEEVYLHPTQYKIVKRGMVAQDTKNVDVSLREQLNDNLGSVFN